MQHKKLLLLATSLFFITGCGNKVPIRSDIENFIASFSLGESEKQYKNSGYETTVTSISNGVTTIENETFYFSVLDLNDIKYEKVYEKSVDGVLASKNIEKCFVENGKFYYQNGEIITETTQVKCLGYIEKFFYTTVISDFYHSGGKWVGEELKQDLSQSQQFITINNEDNLLHFDLDSIVKQDGQEYQVNTHYTVNNLGMLETRNLMISNTQVSVHEITAVYKNINIF